MCETGGKQGRRAVREGRGIVEMVLLQEASP
jgi:hypothetical protein